MKVLSLFSGIGAFEKAFDYLNIPYELVAYCEIDKYASKSYSAIHNVPETMNLGDITKVDEKALPKDIDLVTYGFPCQDISLAGKQKGLFNEDGSKTRSGLFFDALRIIEETQPKVAIAENVKNLVGKKFKEQFRIVLDSLEQAGYNNKWCVLNAKDFGIPQNRERVFIVSIRKDIDNGLFQFPKGFPLELRLKDLLEDEVDEKFYIDDTKVTGLMNFKETTTGILSKQATLFEGETEVANTLLARDYKGFGNQGMTCVVSVSATELPLALDEQNGYIRTDGTVGTLTTDGSSPKHNNRVIVKTNNSKGYDVAEEGDYINIERPNSTTRRGRGGHGVSQCLDTKDSHCVAVEPKIKVIGNYSPSGHDASRVVATDGLAPTVKENHGTVTAIVQHPIKVGDLDRKGCHEFSNRVYSPDGIARTLMGSGGNQNDKAGQYLMPNLRIRRLTPKECFRLQGFEDTDFARAEAVCSNTQLYKQAGNSICVPVVQYILEALIDSGAFGGEPKEIEFEGQIEFTDIESFERYLNYIAKEK